MGSIDTEHHNNSGTTTVMTTPIIDDSSMLTVSKIVIRRFPPVEVKEEEESFESVARQKALTNNPASATEEARAKSTDDVVTTQSKLGGGGGGGRGGDTDVVQENNTDTDDDQEAHAFRTQISGTKNYSKNGPNHVNIGTEEPASILLRQFLHNENLKKQCGKLMKVFRGYRSVRGDGNCYYRALLCSVFEYAIQMSKPEILKELKKDIGNLRIVGPGANVAKSSVATTVSSQQQSSYYREIRCCTKYLREWIRKLYRIQCLPKDLRQKHRNCLVEDVFQLFNAVPQIDFAFIYCLRRLIANYTKANTTLITPAGMTIEEWCKAIGDVGSSDGEGEVQQQQQGAATTNECCRAVQDMIDKEILVMGEDARDITQFVAPRIFLGVSCKIIMIERSMTDFCIIEHGVDHRGILPATTDGVTVKQRDSVAQPAVSLNPDEAQYAQKDRINNSSANLNTDAILNTIATMQNLRNFGNHSTDSSPTPKQDNPLNPTAKKGNTNTAATYDDSEIRDTRFKPGVFLLFKPGHYDILVPYFEGSPAQQFQNQQVNKQISVGRGAVMPQVQKTPVKGFDSEELDKKFGMLATLSDGYSTTTSAGVQYGHTISEQQRQQQNNEDMLHELKKAAKALPVLFSSLSLFEDQIMQDYARWNEDQQEMFGVQLSSVADLLDSVQLPQFENISQINPAEHFGGDVDSSKVRNGGQMLVKLRRLFNIPIRTESGSVAMGFSGVGVGGGGSVDVDDHDGSSGTGHAAAGAPGKRPLSVQNLGAAAAQEQPVMPKVTHHNFQPDARGHHVQNNNNTAGFEPSVALQTVQTGGPGGSVIGGAQQEKRPGIRQPLDNQQFLAAPKMPSSSSTTKSADHTASHVGIGSAATADGLVPANLPLQQDTMGFAKSETRQVAAAQKTLSVTGPVSGGPAASAASTAATATASSTTTQARPANAWSVTTTLPSRAVLNAAEQQLEACNIKRVRAALEYVEKLSVCSRTGLVSSNVIFDEATKAHIAAAAASEDESILEASGVLLEHFDEFFECMGKLQDHIERARKSIEESGGESSPAGTGASSTAAAAKSNNSQQQRLQDEMSFLNQGLIVRPQQPLNPSQFNTATMATATAATAATAAAAGVPSATEVNMHTKLNSGTSIAANVVAAVPPAAPPTQPHLNQNLPIAPGTQPPATAPGPAIADFYCSCCTATLIDNRDLVFYSVHCGCIWHASCFEQYQTFGTCHIHNVAIEILSHTPVIFRLEEAQQKISSQRKSIGGTRVIDIDTQLGQQVGTLLNLPPYVPPLSNNTITQPPQQQQQQQKNRQQPLPGVAEDEVLCMPTSLMPSAMPDEGGVCMWCLVDTPYQNAEGKATTKIRLPCCGHLIHTLCLGEHLKSECKRQGCKQVEDLPEIECPAIPLGFSTNCQKKTSSEWILKGIDTDPVIIAGSGTNKAAGATIPGTANIRGRICQSLKNLNDDINFAQQLQAEEEKEASKAKEFECIFCNETCPVEGSITLPCDHRLCEDCISGYFQANVRGKNPQEQADGLRCPFWNTDECKPLCTKKFHEYCFEADGLVPDPMNIVRAHMVPEEFEKLSSWLAKLSLGLDSCPKCNVEFLVEESENLDLGDIVCPQVACGFRFCSIVHYDYYTWIFNFCLRNKLIL